MSPRRRSSIAASTADQFSAGVPTRVAVVAVVFLGELVEGKDAEATMMTGIGAGALVLALAAFSYATRSSGKPDKGSSAASPGESGDK